LIIANKEENDQSLLASLMEEFPVWISDISNLGDAISMINSIGTITGTSDKATVLTEEILHEFDDLATFVITIPAQKVAYLIWKDPWMSVGSDTFINDMIRRCGWQPVLENEVRYPIVTIEQLQDLRPELLLLSSEPYPFKEDQLLQLQKLFPASIVHLVDGECFSWYGSRLKGSPSYFRRLLHELRKGDCD
jgi:ABC-type Fe3+-hydroxamate transport system substrate-binding protein